MRWLKNVQQTQKKGAQTENYDNQKMSVRVGGQRGGGRWNCGPNMSFAAQSTADEHLGWKRSQSRNREMWAYFSFFCF